MTSKPPKTLKLLLRRLLAFLLHSTGFLRIYRRVRLRGRIPILTYHRVLWPDTTDPKPQPGMYVTPPTFESHMRFLARHHTVISLHQLAHALRSGTPLPHNTCVITFDDGWRDNLIHAVPILRTFNLPASIFVVPAYVTHSDWFWPDKVSWLLPRLRFPLNSHFLAKHPSLHQLQARNDRSQPAVDQFIDDMKLLAPDIRNELLTDLFRLADGQECPTERLLLTWAELRALADDGIVIGSHSHTHEILTLVSPVEATTEIHRSRDEIKRQLGTNSFSFSYPNGNVNDELKADVENAGYVCAVSTRFGLVGAHDDLFCLPRIPIHDDVTFTIPLFACRLAGLL